MVDYATLVYDIDSAQARTAATDLAKLNAATAKVAGGVNSLSRSLRDSQGRFRSSFDVAKQYGGEIRDLAAKYNPAMNAVYKYQQAQLELNRAVALGVLTQSQADAALEGVSAGMRRAAADAQKYQNGMRGVNNVQSSVGNQFAQLNDVVVTAWGGMNPALIGMQQGMQMVQGFAGQSLPQALGTLKGAFAQLLNPMTLLTVGSVALGAAAIQMGTSLLSSGEKSKTLTELIDRAVGSVDDLNAASKKISSSGLASLGERYGTITSSIREMLVAQKDLVKATSIKELDSAFKGLFGTTDNSWAQFIYQADTAIERVGNLASRLGITKDQASDLYNAMNDARNAKSIDEQVAAMQRLRERASETLLTNTALTDKQVEFLNAIIQGEDAARALAAAAAGLPATFSAAAAAAAKITDRLVEATNAAHRLANSSVSDSRFAQIELDFRTDKVGKAAALAAAKFDEEVGKSGMDQWLYNGLREQAIAGAKETAKIMGEVDRLNEADREAKKKDKSGGAELKAAEKQFQSLRQLLENDSLFQVAEYEKRQAQLELALNKRLLTETEYQEMSKQLKTFYFSSEYEQNALQYEMNLEQLRLYLEQDYLTREQYEAKKAELQWGYTNQSLDLNSTALGANLNGLATYFGNANQMAGGGYDKLLKAQKVFAASSAFISAYEGASKALTDPTLTTWQRIAAAGKVLTTGLGFVNAIKGGGGGGGGSRSSSATAAASAAPATPATPARNVMISLKDFSGRDADLIGSVLEQLSEQIKDGGFVISRESS